MNWIVVPFRKEPLLPSHSSSCSLASELTSQTEFQEELFWSL